VLPSDPAARTLSALLRAAARRLGGGHPTGRLDAEVLLSHVLDRPRSHLFAHPETIPSSDQASTFAHLVARRARGEPVAYLTGRKAFWTLELEVSRHTLIPRPETELLVELGLARMVDAGPLRIADLGTGTGAIALALAVERPRAQIVATDVSAAALAVARRNVLRHGLDRVDLRRGSWFEPLGGERFDLIIANPPYVAATDPHLARGDLRFEPAAALRAGADGLDALRTIVAAAGDHLSPGGWLILEHGHDQSRAVAGLFRSHGLVAVQAHRDLAGHPRAIAGRSPDPAPPPVPAD
jgi:release factor glutamine methyltransferase